MFAYKNPFKKRSTTKSEKLFVNDEQRVIKNAIIKVGWITRLRPVVSAKNPHKCDEQIIPRNEAAPSIPFSFVLIFMSHCKTGITKLIPHDSKKTAFKIKPQIKIKK